MMLTRSSNGLTLMPVRFEMFCHDSPADELAGVLGVTDDVAAARDHLRPQMERSSMMPSYHRQMNDEGLTAPVDLAVVGDASAVAQRLRDFEAAH